jgi:hypothetical protein
MLQSILPVVVVNQTFEMLIVKLLVFPLPGQFKSLLPGQEGCVFFSGHLNLRTCQCVLVR